MVIYEEKKLWTTKSVSSESKVYDSVKKRWSNVKFVFKNVGSHLIEQLRNHNFILVEIFFSA